MVPDPATTCVGLEYFCHVGDGLWNMADAGLIELARTELATLGLACPGDISEGAVVRMPKAYPVYDSEYRDALRIVREFIESLGNVQLIGRNGLHKYNNQDHSMLTAMLAVKNLMGEQHDLWAVNAGDDYLEQVTGQTASSPSDVGEPASRLVPERLIELARP